MRKLLIRPQARIDLLEIWHYIASDSLVAADRVAQRLEEEIRGLITMPGKGHFRSDVNDSQYRFWSVYSYVIAYKYNDVTLTVVRVLHGRRDLRKVFKT